VRISGPGFPAAWLAAFIAVIALSFASIQSTVMQVSASSNNGPMVMCGDGSTAPSHANHGAPAGDTQKSCPICSAVAHAPLCAATIHVPVSSAIAWIAYVAVRPLGPRGPPAVAPKARDPPLTLLTV
jgi:hypothetical protein